jgi:hypothetical protein
MDVEKENIINILGIASLPDEEKVQIVDQVSELVQKRLLLRIADSLTEEKKEGLMQLIDSGDEIGLTNFLLHNCPQFNDWLAEELNKVKQEMSSLANAV